MLPHDLMVVDHNSDEAEAHNLDEVVETKAMEMDGEAVTPPSLVQNSHSMVDSEAANGVGPKLVVVQVDEALSSRHCSLGRLSHLRSMVVKHSAWICSSFYPCQSSRS